VTAAGGEVVMLGKSWDRLSQPRFWLVLIRGVETRGYLRVSLCDKGPAA